MTKAEYEAKIEQYRLKIRDEYIASLEAENAKLNRALDVAAESLNHIACGCPKDECDTCVVSWECTHKTVMNYADCWREYALAEAEEEKK